MTTTFLATPETWFDLPSHVAACAEAGVRLELTLTDTHGRRPLADVALDELLAIHHTFGSWWSTLGGPAPPASLGVGAYDRFLSDSRGLLRDQAEAALARPVEVNAPEPALVTFPQRGHVLLTDPLDALAFFKSFLDMRQSPSLIAWARAQSTAGAAGLQGAADAWLRVVLQKVAVEEDLAEVVACLRTLYRDDAVRAELLGQEALMLERCALQHLQQWARTLGLDRSARQEPGIPVSRLRSSDASGEPDVTVIVPSYCHEAFIEITLESVLAQTHSAFRLLVLDDRSSDRTVERASRIVDPRLQIAVNESNLGLGDSVLRAVDCVTTPYVALLNSDDLFHPERLARCTAVLRDSERITVVATGVVPIDDAGCHLTPANVRRLFDGSNVADWIQWFYGTRDVSAGADLLSELLERNFLVTSSNIVCRTEFLRSRRDVLKGLEYCLDWQVFLDAAIDGSLAYLPEELVGYRLHASNTVWFDDARGAAYALEVNRVLASTLRHLAEPSLSRENSLQVAKIVDLLASHAAKHSNANGFLLYLAELLGGHAPVRGADGAEALRKYVHVLSQPIRTTSLAQDGADESRARSNAERVIAATWREAAAVAEGSAQWYRQQLESVHSSHEWLLGNGIWNTARLSRIGLPAARALRWLRHHRHRVHKT